MTTQQKRPAPAKDRPIPNNTKCTQFNTFTGGAADLLTAEAIAIKVLGADVLDATDIGTHAVEYALAGWEICPAGGGKSGKGPVIPSPHPKGSVERATCRGECGLDGHGVYDATSDIIKVIGWWAGRWRGHGILARVPMSMVVVDIDPQNGGDVSLAALLNEYGQLPDTLTTISGRGTGGMHLYYRRPPGALTSKQLGPGIDIKQNNGLVMLAPSLHPETGKPYIRVDRPVADPPQWLVDLLRVEPPQPAARPARRTDVLFNGPSIADQFEASTTWSEVLEPHGWSCVAGDPDADGARWRRPGSTSLSDSASILHNKLFVYSTSTEFDSTEAGHPKGYTKFHAFAILNHRGDRKTAARHLIGNS